MKRGKDSTIIEMMEDMLISRKSELKHQSKWLADAQGAMRHHDRLGVESVMWRDKYRTGLGEGTELEKRTEEDLNEFIKWGGREDKYVTSWKNHVALLEKEILDLEKRIKEIRK